MRWALSILVLAGAAAGAFAVGQALTDAPTTTRPNPGAAELAQVRTRLVRRYYVPVPENVLRQRTIPATIAALRDPYTEYLSPFAVAELSRRTRASYTGIGVNLLPREDALVVASTVPGPGRRAGLRPGDRILAIDGTPTAGLAFEQAVGRILGHPETAVRLDVRRGGRVLRLTVRRERIVSHPVAARLLRGRIGYVKVLEFDGGTTAELRREIVRLERSGAGGLVLDLRNNPGGLLDEAVGSASIFVGGRKLLTVEGEHEATHELRAPADVSVSNVRLALLVNRYTASAAEVVAAALHDNERAALVGERTFGKAVVQSIEPLPSGAALKLTTARYVTPSGTDLSRKGLLPDVEAVDDPGTEADEALETAVAAVE
jgi:carboxyl-terminal processing protease